MPLVSIERRLSGNTIASIFFSFPTRAVLSFSSLKLFWFIDTVIIHTIKSSGCLSRCFQWDTVLFFLIGTARWFNSRQNVNSLDKWQRKEALKYCYLRASQGA